MAQRNNIKISDSWKNAEMTGREWLRSFRNRHTDLSLRKSEPCILARATSFNRDNVNRFFNNLYAVINWNGAFSDGRRIYNLNETASTTVQKRQKILAPKENKCLGKVTSGEKGMLVTTCSFICAGGYALPPAIIFPRKNYKDFMLKGAPTGSLGLATLTGWMNSELFIEIMKHCIKHSRTSPDNPSILIFDNHESYLSIEALDLAKSVGVNIVTLHPHTSAKLQPLDVGLYTPFKTCYNSATESWLLRNPGRPLSIYDLAECIGVAHSRSMTLTNIAHTFNKCGIYPSDRDIFTDQDFLLSEVTNRSCLNDEKSNNTRDLHGGEHNDEITVPNENDSSAANYI
ncbi:uncharacterized protein [Diabrotica undecimpunctata]|uniref:uncharacterized protein n=1 Tax=Diabrotica undecimpunctata TaxID=50387 RepID=UPI003B63866A